MSDSLNLGGEGGNAFPFDNIGDSVTGRVTSMQEVQQTDMNTNEPAFWPDGKKKIMYHVELATSLRDPADPADGGGRSVYLRGSVKPETQSSLSAVRGAVKAVTGSYALQVGGTLTLEFVGEEAPAQRGHNGRKLYTAKYEAPSVTLGAADPTSPAPAAPAAPVAASATSAPAPAVSAGADPLASLTPEQRAALGIPAQPTAPAWDADPRVGALRAAGLADEAIRAALQI